MTTHATTEFQTAAFFLADHASVENGKVYVNGGFWDRMQLPSFPAAVNFSIVAVVVVPWHAHNEKHGFSVTFEDADKNMLAGQFDGEFQIGTEPSHRQGDASIVPLAIAVTGFALDSPNDYAAVLSIDGHEVDRWPMRVLQL
ncbi:MAG: hypothetical protein U0R28_09690 [Candidatus Nanopelagicales bacterium]